MAEITYNILRKPIEERIFDAACIYWEVPRMYFKQKTKQQTVVYRRAVVWYVLRHNTVYSFAEISQKLGLPWSGRAWESVDKLEAQKNIYRQVCEDINQITFLASKLDADFVTTSITLSNKNNATIQSGTV